MMMLKWRKNDLDIEECETSVKAHYHDAICVKGNVCCTSRSTKVGRHGGLAASLSE